MPTEDGYLGLAGILGSSLYLWSRKVNAEGVEEWIQCRVIELQKLLPVEKPWSAEGADVIFMGTDVGAFIIELKSGRARKISEAKIFYFVVPFMTFYTPDSDCVKGKLLIHGEAH
ncbi:hypothetical protein QOZ80_7AG0554130 [Eleusine coracana subsp. coracana]|nr:hypothetical protein QOZ80_7AG0554130 [Eleusine coracana subsp. coracana]